MSLKLFRTLNEIPNMYAPKENTYLIHVLEEIPWYMFKIHLETQLMRFIIFKSDYKDSQAYSLKTKLNKNLGIQWEKE